MFKYEPPVDLSQEPWHTWDENGRRVYGSCRYCNARYDNSFTYDSHHAWCKWWTAYCEASYAEDDQIENVSLND
jgi:hypothetical protein